MNSESTPLFVTNKSDEEGISSMKKARRLLYISHFSSQFSQQSWEFGLTIFLAAVTNYQSLILVSTYGVIACVVVCLLGPSVGKFFVDSGDWNRISSARCLIWSQNVCVIIATALFYAQLNMNNNQTLVNGQQEEVQTTWLQHKFQGVPNDIYSILLIVGIHVFGPLAQILDKAFLVTIERDWVVVMGEQAAKLNYQNAELDNWLAETNVFMKQIDLSCRVAAPSFAGLLIGSLVKPIDETGRHFLGSDLAFASFLIGLLNGLSLIVEYISTALIYQLVPALATKYPATNSHPTTDISPAVPGTRYFQCLPRVTGLTIYFAQPTAWAGLCLATLYFNVLTFGSLMTAYLLWKGMSLESAGWWRGVSATLGLAGTFVFRVAIKKMSLVSTGMWSLLYQLVCISTSIASLQLTSNNYSTAIFIACVCASRIGLWVFDISVTQLMQEFTPVGYRGIVGGTQHSLNAFFQLALFIAGFAFPLPSQFPIIAIAGCIVVSFAALGYIFFISFRQNNFQTKLEND